MSTSESDRRMENGRLFKRVRASYYIPEVAVQDPLSDLDLHEPLNGIAKAFQASVNGLLATASLPFSLGHAASLNKYFQKTLMAERIRARGLDQSPGESEIQLEERREMQARKISQERFSVWEKTPEGQEAIAVESCSFMLEMLRDARFRGATAETLLQAAVLCWSALEVAARDVFIALLNGTPTLFDMLLADVSAKRRFDGFRFSKELLAENAYDVSKKMGTLLAAQQDLSDISSIKSVFCALFPKIESLRVALSSEALRLASLRRNLIVHRRGIVDERYRLSTGCPQPIGERLVLTPDDLDVQISATVSAGKEILLASAPASPPTAATPTIVS